jgi:hypothetical protein
LYCPQFITFQPRASSLGLDSGSKGERVADLLRGQREAQRHAILGVAVDAVGVDLLHQRGYSLWPGLAGLVRALIPHHHGEEHAHAAAMEVGDHLAHALEAAGHGLDHFQLVAVIDPMLG